MPGIHDADDGDFGDFDDMMIFPITDIDNNNDADDEGCGGPYGVSKKDSSQSEDDEDSDDAEPKRPSFVSLRQRRYSQLGLGNGPLLKLNINQVSKPVPIVESFRNNNAETLRPGNLNSPSFKGMSPGKARWLLALKKLRSLKDPWEKFQIGKLPTERVIRHRYTALHKKWKEDEVYVKMQNEPFNHGAMRSCFRLKKASAYSHGSDWKHALNYVAKLYMEDVDRNVYFEDVRLQMDAKLWGEEYNRHNPPKKVDIFQMYVLEFVDRPGRPLYHLEHFIEGDYIKYNSNSGFVDESLRFTPQAFSHFTFERSGHKLIVVDIQGVGDLWTDPQVHTMDGDDYGDGNLGPRGMALFFHSHVCNSICESLALTKFDLSPKEVEQQEEFIRAQAKVRGRRGTVARGCEEMVVSASPRDRSDLTSFLARQRSRTMSSCSDAFSMISEETGEGSECSARQSEDEPMTPGSPAFSADVAPFRPRRVRFLSESESDSASTTLTENDATNGHKEEDDDISGEEDRVNFMRAASQAARPSCVAHEINLRNLQNFRQQEDSVLGQVHHELSKYHEIGRFSTTGEVDIKAAIFHEQHAADLGVKEAILTMAHLYLDLPHDVLSGVTVEPSEDNIIQGVDYMIMAADVGDRGAMIYMAKAFETGSGLGNNRTKSYKEAVRWYNLAINTTQQDESGEFDATMDSPLYQLQAKMAELHMEGGFNLEKDPTTAAEYYNEAAENAMAAMKGRLANKYYALAEEAYGMVEEEEE